MPDVLVTLTVTAPPVPVGQVLVSPQALGFVLRAGASAAATETLTISAPAGQPFEIVSNAPWLTASPAVGSIPRTVDVSAAGRALAPGSYAGSITVASGALDPVEVPCL